MSSQKRVLVLGAGLVAAPLVEYLHDRAGCSVVVASNQFDDGIEKLAGEAVELRDVDAGSADALRPLIEQADLTVSLLPAVMHTLPARLCVQAGRSLVTASYTSDAMKELDGEARAAGVILLNECGLDPGIDHMAAMHAIDRVRAEGGRVVRFSSMTGGLPAPESDDNPWHYKFSWSPAGVLRAATRPSRFIREAQVVEIPGTEIFDHVHTLHIDGVGDLEVYPNGDAVKYRDAYGLRSVDVVFRGTLRYPGHCATWKQLVRLGFFDDATPINARTYGDLVLDLSQKKHERPLDSAAAFLGIPTESEPISRFGWLGLFSDREIPDEARTAFDALLALMLDRLQYAPGESDLIVIRKQITVQPDDGGDLRRLCMTVIAKGQIDQQSAMSRTVGWPAAIAARLILEGRIRQTGVQIPNIPEIYEPVLAELGELGLQIEEHVEAAD